MGLKKWFQETEPPYVLSDAILQFIDSHLLSGQAAELEDWLQEWIHPPTSCRITTRYFNTFTVAIVVYGHFRIKDDDRVILSETVKILKDLKSSYNGEKLSITQKVVMTAALVLIAERSKDPSHPNDPQEWRQLDSNLASVVDEFYRSQKSLTSEQVTRVKRLLEGAKFPVMCTGGGY